jgi:hypothetical protein
VVLLSTPLASIVLAPLQLVSVLLGLTLLVDRFLNVFLEMPIPLQPPAMIRASAQLNLAFLMVLANGAQLIAL